MDLKALMDKLDQGQLTQFMLEEHAMRNRVPAGDLPLANFLTQACTLFAAAGGPLAARSAALLGALPASALPASPPSARAPLSDADPSCAPPAELKDLLPPGGRPPLEAVRALYRGLSWYRSSRSGTPCAQVVGPGGLVEHGGVRAGLFLICADYLYPDHAHNADEVYIVLAGSAEWSLERGAFAAKQPGDAIEIPSQTAHAIRTREQPALMLWSWTGDIAMSSYRFL